MKDQQTGNRQPGPPLARGPFFALCFIFAAILVMIWVMLASKGVEVEVTEQQPAVEQSVTTNDTSTGRQGKWYVSLATFRLEKEAAAMLKRIRQRGVKAEYVPFIGSRKGYQWYRVRVAGFASEQAAKDELEVLSKKLGIRNAWVGEEF